MLMWRVECKERGEQDMLARRVVEALKVLSDAHQHRDRRGRSTVLLGEADELGRNEVHINDGNRPSDLRCHNKNWRVCGLVPGSEVACRLHAGGGWAHNRLEREPSAAMRLVRHTGQRGAGSGSRCLKRKIVAEVVVPSKL